MSRVTFLAVVIALLALTASGNQIDSCADDRCGATPTAADLSAA